MKRNKRFSAVMRSTAVAIALMVGVLAPQTASACLYGAGHRCPGENPAVTTVTPAQSIWPDSAVWGVLVSIYNALL